MYHSSIVCFDSNIIYLLKITDPKNDDKCNYQKSEK